MYKKIYLEITNKCNLNCSFCLENKRDKKYIDIKDFKIILEKIKPYTKYLYFHLSGEPLMHTKINELIKIASKDFFINITTNGYLIKRIEQNKNIRQINISLHSYDIKYKISIEDYLNNIIEVIEKLHNNTYISLRFWVNNPYTLEIISYLEKYYNKKIKLENGFKIIENVFISINKEFIWPNLDNEYYSNIGTCYALKDHLGILVNGDVVPCCLDMKGIIKLGNILDSELEDIIKTERYQKMLVNFQNHKKVEELCKKCNFLE